MEQPLSECKNHTAEMLSHLVRGTPWALAMFDSSTKIPNGILMGNSKHFGNYDECLDVEVKEDFGSFRGQHCMVRVKLPVFGQVIWSVCVPSTCSSKEVEDILHGRYDGDVIVDPLLCHTRQYNPLTTLEWGAIGILSVFVLLVILSTIYDFAVKSPEQRNVLLLSFSFHTNGKHMLQTTKASDDTLHALHGVRVIGMWWLICLHVYQGAYEQFAGINRVVFLQASTDWNHLFLTARALQIDIYFLLGGLLLSYVFLKDKDHGKEFSLMRFYLHRYLRVTPALAVIVLINATLFNRLGSGPIWEHNILGKQSDCLYYGWTLLLYIRNYTQANTCLIQSWPLNIDMQMYVLSPILLIPLHRRPRLGLTILTLTIIGGMVTIFTSAYIHKVPMNYFKYSRLQVVQDMYMQTHTRCTPWLIGIGLGYILHCFKRREKLQQPMTLSMATVAFGWLLCIFALIGSHLVVHPFLQPDYEYDPLESSFVLALTRPVWSFGVAWLIFACVSGYAGFLNSFLSCDTFLLLSRFAYGTTMVHSTVVQARAFSIKTSTYVSDFIEFSELAAVVIFCLIGGVLMALIVEIPIINIAKHLLDTKVEKRQFRMQFSIDETRTVNPSRESVAHDLTGHYSRRNNKSNQQNETIMKYL